MQLHKDNASCLKPNPKNSAQQNSISMTAYLIPLERSIRKARNTGH